MLDLSIDRQMLNIRVGRGKPAMTVRVYGKVAAAPVFIKEGHSGLRN